MGKGDKKSRRGKIHIGSFGVRRPRKTGTVVHGTVQSTVEEKPVKPAEKVKKTEPVVESAVEVATEVKKPARKTAKKVKEEAAPEE